MRNSELSDDVSDPPLKKSTTEDAFATLISPQKAQTLKRNGQSLKPEKENKVDSDRPSVPPRIPRKPSNELSQTELPKLSSKDQNMPKGLVMRQSPNGLHPPHRKQGGLSGIFAKPRNSRASFTPFNMFTSAKFFGSSSNRSLGDLPSSPIDDNDEEKKLEVLKFDDARLVGSSKPKPWRKIFVGFLVVAVFSAILIPAIVIPANQGSSSATCGSAARDAEIRAQIALLNENSASQVLEVKDVLLECLPSDALGQVPAENLTTFNSIVFEGNGITKISPSAFNNPNLSGIVFLRLSFQGLTDLPKNLFDPLPALQDIVLESNAFSSLDDDLFNNENFLVISLSENSGLTEVPPALAKATNLQTLGLAGCSSMIKVKPGLFSGLTSLVSIVLDRSRLGNFFTEIEFRNETGLGPDVIVLGLP